MYDTEPRTAFIELRAKGWSIKRIAARLKVAPRTLVDWHRQDNDTIRTLRALELEALQEKILATREQELQTLKNNLDTIHEQIAMKDHQFTSLENLYRLAALVRAEIRKVCQTPDFSDPSLTEQPEAGSRRALPEPLPTPPEAMARSANPPAGQNSSAAATPAGVVAGLADAPVTPGPQDQGSIQVVD